MKRESLADLGIAGVLLEIRDELRGLRADLAQRRAGVDPELRALLHEIHSYVGTGVVFSASALIAQGDAALIETLGDMGPAALGRCLARAEGRVVDGRIVQRAGRDELGVTWVICRADDS